MKEVFVTGDNIISSLGFTTAENYRNLKAGKTGISMVTDPALFPSPLALSLVDSVALDQRFTAFLSETGKGSDPASFTRLEQMILLSIHDAIHTAGINPSSERLLFILSTTKGNINLLEEKFRLTISHKRLYLWELARLIQSFCGFVNTPVVVSNACISGVVALMMASRMIHAGRYDRVVVTGGDIASEFVISGFHSFQSLSPGPCRPFDASRDGLSLGEGCGTMILSGEAPPSGIQLVRVLGSATTNDANHISGPSRTGEELALAMRRALAGSGLGPEGIQYISAHGTATPFNDEMESKALMIAGLNTVPVNSFKGYWGHTLGAAGLIESVAAVHSMLDDTLISSAGFESLGVPEPIRVIGQNIPAHIGACMKTASGFGGCNAALVFEKV
jgi:3-oxoacyl-[acyl-carrier-protein] synthase I